MIKWWQDWRRGYSDLDMAFVKLMVVSGINPTFVRTLSNRQFNALLYLSENSKIDDLCNQLNNFRKS